MGTYAGVKVQSHTIWFFSLFSIIAGRFITDAIYLHYSIYNFIPLKERKIDKSNNLRKQEHSRSFNKLLWNNTGIQT
jgi:hypothetical protein